MGHRIDAIISPKAASEKAQTTVSENRYTYPKIDVYRTATLTLIATTGDNVRASFLVHQDRGDGAGPAGTAAAGPMLEAKLMNLINGWLQKF